jgi:hypothetical protein
MKVIKEASNDFHGDSDATFDSCSNGSATRD